MLKAIKGLKKKLGSSVRLADSGEAPTGTGAVAEPLPASAAALAVNGQAAEAQQQQQQQQAADGGRVGATALPPAAPTSPSMPMAAGLPPRPSPQSPPHFHYHEEAGGELAVDYELVAGPLELDGALGNEAEVGTENLGAGLAGAKATSRCVLKQEQEQGGKIRAGCINERDEHGWQDSVKSSGGPLTEDEEVAAAAGGRGSVTAAADATAAEGAAAAAEAAASEGITDALATMMYLTEDAEECMSMVSDALSEEDLPDDISELSRALEALEGEALGTSSANAAVGPSSFGADGSGLDDQLAERLGISPDAGDPTAYSQQMAKLYNNLGLKMMERRKHEEALGLLRKAEAIVENDAMWCGQGQVHRRQRMQAITYNNLGCLFKRHNMPQLALQYLQRALALEEKGGPVQNSSSTHLNISAAFSALKRPKEALAHAERAIILLQRHLWAHHLPFQDGLSHLVRQLAMAGASRQLLASANVLAMAYHNAAVEHEKLGRLREALVSFTRAYLIASKCLGAKAQMTASLSKALKAFQQRQARYLPSGAAHAARKAPSTLTSSAHQSKRGLGHSRGSSKSVFSSKSSSSLSSKSMGSLAAAAANGKATLPLDKASRATGSGLAGVRPPSASRLASQLQQH